MESAPGATATPPGVGPGEVVLVCAAPAERRALRGVVRPGVCLVASGMGAGPTGRAAAEVVARAPAALVAVGFCGALDPALRVGDVVAATEVYEEAGRERLATDARLLAAAPGRHGTLVSAARIARTPADRAALVEAAGAGALAVDLESAALARAAAGSGVPFLALRAVTDEAHHRLPDLDRLMDAAGRLTPGAGLLHFVRRPRELPALARLGPASRTAGAALAEAVDTLLGGIR